ncbi:Peptide deformylase [Methylophaga frappieri]|uniref:Peptide deformylase n=1 Tax=Methylophaga frappieri (strain ATCC BAA-2434 / DSM 25690 / JAM7) TaxID=754477 RepID=I1YGI2_METFJ|nr:peptide deformylase [Methylophaga frappieri]AFJ02025.1 Peptide deformylase [Methylophaga frappieri]
MTDLDWEIRELGHPQLRKPANPVLDIAEPDTQRLLDNLLTFVVQKQGMGIAAPQVGISLQIFIMCSHPNQRYPNAPVMKPACILNPTILHYSTEMEKDWEGCLSIPGLRALVPRSNAIDVAYDTRQGERVQIRYTGFLARLFQHEYDHLQGRLFIDHVDSTLDIMTEKQWRNTLSTMA